MADLTASEQALIDELAKLFGERLPKVEAFLRQVQAIIEPELKSGGKLENLVHSTKWRIKSEEHLREKIARKIREGKDQNEPYDISTENLFFKVTDLAAYRIMHLHPKQMTQIHPALLELFQEKKLELFEEPAARVWDLETKKFFERRCTSKQFTPRRNSTQACIMSWSRTGPRSTPAKSKSALLPTRSGER
jgi:putative GTP pyrophosphokinase